MTDQNELPILNSRLNYIAIPIELIACPFFTYKEKEVITEILGLSDKYLSYGGCSRSNKNLAFRHRITPEKISNIITMANRLGFVASREDIVHKSKSSIGYSQYSTQRKIIMSIPDEWKAMGDLYNEAFIRENEEVVEIFELIEKELRELNKTDISQEVVSEIILKQFTPYKNKNLPPLSEKGLASYKSNINKSKKEKDSLSLSDDRSLESWSKVILKDKHLPDKKTPSVSNQDILTAWNKMASSAGLNTIIKITPHRQKHISSRLKDFRTLREWRRLFNKVAASPFLCGDNDRDWQADFDWLIKNEDNPEKVMEGKYNGHDNTKKKSRTRLGGAKVILGKYDDVKTWEADAETGKQYLKGSPEHKEWLKTRNPEDYR